MSIHLTPATTRATGTRYGVSTGSWPLGAPEDGRFYVRFAQQVERSGFDLMTVGDHIFMYNPNSDALSLLAAFSTITERLLLGTIVLLPALREPVITAKQLATIDHLSNGRLVVGVGVGGEIEQEWRAMEIPRNERGARTDAALDLMRAYWSGEELEYHGRFRTVTGVTGSPRCATPGGPPIWIGGRSDKALERAARYDGWCAYSSSVNRIRRSREFISNLRGDMSDFRITLNMFACIKDDREEARSLLTDVLSRRYEQDFSVYLDAFCAVGTKDDVLEQLDRFREAGVQDFIFAPQVGHEEIPEQVDRLADALDLPAYDPIATVG